MKSETKILVVDDERETLSALGQVLSIEGYDVRLASNGLEALEEFRSNNFDLIITDLDMPDMDGNELLKQAKQLNPNIGVIILTGFGEIGSYMESMNLGAVDYINKPIKSKELIRIAQTYLGKM